MDALLARGPYLSHRLGTFWHRYFACKDPAASGSGVIHHRQRGGCGPLFRNVVVRCRMGLVRICALVEKGCVSPAALACEGKSTLNTGSRYPRMTLLGISVNRPCRCARLRP